MAEREPWATKRERTRRALSGTILDLVRRHGFDRVTVDEIVEVAGASRTTFFRYFATKSDAILYHLDAAAGELLRQAERALGNGPPWSALRLACIASTRYLLLWPDVMRVLLDVIDGHAALRAGRLVRADTVQRELAVLVAAGGEQPSGDLVARCAVAVVESAIESWRSDETVDLVRSIVAGFDRLAPTFG